MAGWFRRLLSRPDKPSRDPLADFVFRTGEDVFELLCKYADNEVRSGTIYYGLVIDDVTQAAQAAYPNPHALPWQRMILIKLPNTEKPVEKFCYHDARQGHLATGDLIAWTPTEHHELLGWQGPILAKCAPEFTDDGLKVITYYEGNVPQEPERH